MDELTYWLIWILITLLHFLLMFEWLLVCLGWIMKATYCLLRYNPELMLDVVNLNMPCFCCEIPRESCQWLYLMCLTHLTRRLTDGLWSEASFEDVLIFYALFLLFLLYGGCLLFLSLVQCMGYERRGESRTDSTRGLGRREFHWVLTCDSDRKIVKFIG